MRADYILSDVSSIQSPGFLQIGATQIGATHKEFTSGATRGILNLNLLSVNK